MRPFIEKIVTVLDPSHLVALSQRPFSSGVFFFSKVMALAFVLMALLYVPTFADLPSYFQQQLSKFSALSIQSNLSVMAPVYFPERDGFLVIDTTGLHKNMKGETFLVTSEGLHYQLFGTEYFIKAETFSDVLANKDSFAVLFIAILVIILPSIVFWSYALLWFRYLIMIVLLGSIFFTLFDLTHFRKSWKQMLNIAAYASALPIMIEVLSQPINSSYLVPLLGIIGIDMYLVPLIIHAVLVVLLAFTLHYAGEKRARS